MPTAQVNHRAELYKNAIVIDQTAPILINEDDWPKWHKGGVTAAFATLTEVPEGTKMPSLITSIATWLAVLRRNSDKMLLVTSVDHFHEAKVSNKLGVVFHFQNGAPLEYDLNLLEVYKRLGVRVIQLTYNIKNQIGDGCLERTNAGLSDFGVSAIKEMNRLGIAVDLSHTGIQTTLDAMKISAKPVLFTHANARAINPHPRNLTDEQLKCLAGSGGTVGLNAFPPFIKAGMPRPALSDLLDHLDYIAKLIGVQHIGLGLDYYHADAAVYARKIRDGEWNLNDYPPPPWEYPTGIENASLLENIVPALSDRGYSDSEIEGILGGNVVRVLKEIWAG